MNDKDERIVADQGFFVNRRDVGYESKEELIDIALNEKILIEKLLYLNRRDKYIVSAIRNRDEKRFTFFWETKSPFSQWHKSDFVSYDVSFHCGILSEQKEYLKNSLPKELKFNCAEQFMMYHKAIIFLDREIATEISKTSNPRKMKELGRQIRNYDNDVWKYHRSNVVYAANALKFQQNPSLMNVLVDTMGTTLVEAAPNDNIWGIGLAADNPKSHKRDTWEGKNLLGEILTLLRMEFVSDY